MAATSSMGKALENAKTLLANCGTFQDLLEVSTANDALPKIYLHAAPEPTDNEAYTRAEIVTLRPYAVVYTAENNGYRRVRVATTTYADAGTIMVEIFSDAATGTPSAEMVTWEDLVGDIVDEMKTLAETDGYLLAEDIRVEEVARGSERTESGSGDYLVALIAINWSGGA